MTEEQILDLGEAVAKVQDAMRTLLPFIFDPLHYAVAAPLFQDVALVQIRMFRMLDEIVKREKDN